ncbi:MAG TPA: 16S rRNA (adenine(1518)-N(6)/adenine(1519)-N(6))-dimethyltransferase RsmA [Acidisarcina sp.]|nr:16S rRNA (adenine(1518)-N(6)/adenine(1519)-N(6))-dimethyltransferase RsmA [Acidisarcina sp.]
MALKPKLGQNFLIDPGAATGIADALGDISQQTVVEIGPGRGAITHHLAARAAKLVAVELDPTLAAKLREDFADRPSVEIVQHDILTLELASLLRAPDEKLMIVGNLPYYITSDILLRLFDQAEVLSRAVLMVQREVADRVAAFPGTRDYGLLSTTTQLYARVEKLFTLPPDAFAPPPDVYSTVFRMSIRPRFAELGVKADEFLPLLRQCFAQKRKTLANNLKAVGYDAETIRKALAESGIDPHARAEALSLETLARLHLTLYKQ